MNPGGRRLIGVVLDRRYRIDAPIARGGMSTVYRGMDLRLDRPVAIKVMDPQFAADPQFLARFEFEARAVARLAHPGLVAVHDQGSDGEHAFLVMELVEGGTLRELLRERGPMPPHAAAAVARPVLEALAVAHRAGLVHRDIKPENVLISHSGDVKIADFGLVRAIAAAGTTSRSVILGTAAYLSPEQVTTGTADARSDVYAAGVLLYEMLTGATPFTGDTSLSIAYQRIDNDVPEPSTVIDGVPAEFDDLVVRATERDPEQRFADAGAMAAQLRTVSTQLGLPDYRVPAPRRSAQQSATPTAVTPRAPGAPGPYAEPGSRPVPAADAPTTVTPAAAPQDGVQHTKVVTTVTPRPADDDVSPLDAPPARRPFGAPGSPQHGSRRTVLVWLLVILLVAGALGFGGWWLGSGRYAAIPAVDGLDKAGATSQIEAAGLSVQTRGAYSDTVAIDTPVGTDPAAGERVTRGSSVVLLVSLGRPTVPEVGGRGDVAAVEASLRERTFVPVDGGEAFSARVPVGGIAALEPAPGTVLSVGSEVRMLRSKGAPPVDVPGVEGMSEDAARKALDSVGITVRDVQQVFDDKIDAGDAVGTEPAAGASVKAGTSVVLKVSNAVKVPALLGRSVSSAKSELDKLGLQYEVRQIVSSDRSLIISQSPGAGDRVAPGGTVTITSLL
ncbi:Stk1 family PASTA domain-containing Ser/Thr kinase [Rhodococcus hoagii]|uniref:non-specific serine/threonine protein kinase n=1 Tax=Rhodococcus hoagii (strain 103S) TaxID=685727 RepID=A0A3S5Y8G5_RHOH1|nr:Stk1 family PASTA domain-containing Ser/Thr kinase [Prescottella equi]NKR86999.1 Stk1 family PASTA domain-containing Ser/Thr kinase [Prescottella equi]NKS09123.1 Stk1 family PASTA domain-containing Ser/Thr kinase [Prescottella equi]NKT09242.1 Stk1 family PASTA domain-containing Ser/Thr kinase [Prescottella equi]NKT19455.1 Stk1 family PASTA domain-containing Ser/Thr kinase [Prescottella equi]NKT34368.1 Stk1 family PASTA domain-containing Ser/Thr kinase [Prescottella equi]